MWPNNNKAVFAGLTNVTNRQTDWPRYSVSSNSPPSLAVAAMRPDINKRLLFINVIHITQQEAAVQDRTRQ